MTSLEIQVCDAYRAGHGVSEISRMFDIRTVEVIGIVRSHNVQPPGMGVRRPQPVESLAPVVAPIPDPVVLTPAAPLPRPEPMVAQVPEMPVGRPVAPKGKPVARSAPSVAVDADWDEEEEEEMGSRNGRPRGWLMAEEAVSALYARSGQRYQDVLLRTKPAARPPVSLIQPAPKSILSRRAA